MKPGRLRYALAEKLSQLTGWLVEADDIQQNNPIHVHYLGVCRWDCTATIPHRSFKGHIYSWDTMADCVKFGVVKVDSRHDNPAYETEVCAAEKAHD